MWRLSIGAFFALALALALALAACEPTDSFEPEIARADEAMIALQTRLIEALTTELDQSGPAGAIHVCRDTAPETTSEVSTEAGLTVARTSHRLRNPDNAPPEWAREIVAQGAGTKVEVASQHVVDLGDRVGIIRPIGTLGMCTTCHGDKDSMDPELLALIAESYPEDAATGFEVGDLRGWMWAEVPRD